MAALQVNSACTDMTVAELLCTTYQHFTGLAAIMVSKIDQCMLDLMRFHGEGEEAGSDDSTDGSSIQQATPSATVTTSPPQLGSQAHTGVLDSASSADGDISKPAARQRRLDEGRFL